MSQEDSVRVSPRYSKDGRVTSWQIDYRANNSGKIRRVRKKIPNTSTDTAEEEALDLAQIFYLELQKEEEVASHNRDLVRAADTLAEAGYSLGRIGEAGQWTVRHAWEMWQEVTRERARAAPGSRGTSTSTAAVRKWALSAMPDRILDRKLHEVTSRDIEHLQMQMLLSGVWLPSSVGKILDTMAGMLKWAVTRRQALPRSPFDGAALIPVPRNKITYHTPKQRDVILGALPQPWCYMFGLIFFVGLRHGEMLGLHVSDRASEMVLIERTKTRSVDACGPTKTRRSRTIPLCRSAVRCWDGALRWRSEQRSHAHSPALFPSKKKRYTAMTTSTVAWWRTLRTLESVPQYPPGSARHTFATCLIDGGASLYEVSKLLGHSSTATTEEYYAAMTPSRLRAAVDLLDGAGTVEHSGNKKIISMT